MRQGGQHLHYIACPKCRDRGADRAGDNMSVFSDGSKHCWACGNHEFPKGYERLNRGNESVRAEKSLNLPNDLSKTIPTRALKWLLQYGLPYSYWQPYLLWSEKDSRLIFKVGEPTEFYQGRYIPNEDEESRALQRSGGFSMGGASTGRQPRKWYCYGNAHKTAHLFGNPETSKSIILVEDLLSAHKVSQVNATIPLFGTNIFDSVINVLRLYKLPVTFWLDKDQNGNIIKKCNRVNMLTGLPVKYVFSQDDPKSLSLEDIKNILTNG